VPGKELIWGTEGFRREDASVDDVHALYMAGIDYDFLPTFAITLLAGRNFAEDHRTDQLHSVMINEEACRLLGFEDPEKAIGTNLVFFDSKKEIIGVVANYHQESLKREIKPTFYQLLPRALDYFAIKIPTDDIPSSIATVKAQWTTAFGDHPFEYFFLDDFFNAQYEEDQQFGRVFSTFTALSICIACIGLFGISSRTILQRTREIGVRKILGATIVNVFQLLSGYYLKLVAIAFLIAVPISYLAAKKWLDTFAFRIDVASWILLAPFVVMILITIATIGFQALKVSLTNPVKSLRSE
jgi:putative ABC transport system permease protein